LFIATVAILIIPTLPALAVNYNVGPYGACQYNACSITISSDGTVLLNVTPTSSGSCTIQNDTVSVFTENPSGYILSLNNSSTDTSLRNGSATINSTTGSQTGPVALTSNSWGYRVDGVGGFGSGPTTSQSNVSLNSTLFAIVPANNLTPDTIASTSIPANPTVNTQVWYGVCASTAVSSGSYTTQVTYTAVTN